MRKGDPNSKRGRVRSTFREEGEAAAMVLGQSLGVTPARLRRWFKMFSGTLATPAKASRAAPELPTSRRHRGGERVYLTFDPRCHGTVIERGPEQTVVRWDNSNVDRIHNNTVVKLLKPLKE